MSILQVNQIKDASGNNPMTVADLNNTRAKVWFNLNGTGTIAARDSFNVSSFTDLGTGTYRASFTTALANANYAFSGLAGGGAGYGILYHDLGSYTRSTTALDVAGVYSINNTGGVAAADYALVNCAVIGDS